MEEGGDGERRGIEEGEGGERGGIEEGEKGREEELRRERRGERKDTGWSVQEMEGENGKDGGKGKMEGREGRVERREKGRSGEGNDKKGNVNFSTPHSPPFPLHIRTSFARILFSKSLLSCSTSAPFLSREWSRHW